MALKVRYQLMDAGAMRQTLEAMASKILEASPDRPIILLGIQRRGGPLARRIWKARNIWADDVEERESARSGALEELIVTALKREENIQDIPQSIQAFSQADNSLSRQAGG